RESLRDLRRAGRTQGRTQGLRYQQRHDPFPSRQGHAGCPRAEANQGPDRGERGSKQQSTATSDCAFARCTCKFSGMRSTHISRRVNAPRAAVYLAFVPEYHHRLIELLNLQWLLQNRDGRLTRSGNCGLRLFSFSLSMRILYLAFALVWIQVDGDRAWARTLGQPMMRMKL